MNSLKEQNEELAERNQALESEVLHLYGHYSAEAQERRLSDPKPLGRLAESKAEPATPSAEAGAERV